MGGSSSKSSQLNDILNKTSTEVMVAVSSKGAGTLALTQDVNISGNTGDVYGVNIEQVGSIDLTVIQDASINAQLQDKLSTGLESAIKQAKSDFPAQFSPSSSDTEITNIVKNEVSAKFSVESIASLQLDIKSKQNVNITGNSGDVGDVNVTAKVTGIGKLVNTLSTDIIKQLEANNIVKSSTENTQTNAASDMIKSVGDAFNSVFSGIFGPLSDIVIIAICAGAGLVIFFLAMHFMSGGKTNDLAGMFNPQMMMPRMMPQQLPRLMPQQQIMPQQFATRF